MQKSVIKWKSDINGPNYLARELDFLYTDANLSFQNLKGKDNQISEALCSISEIEVYLACLTDINKVVETNSNLLSCNLCDYKK